MHFGEVALNRFRALLANAGSLSSFHHCPVAADEGRFCFVETLFLNVDEVRSVMSHGVLEQLNAGTHLLQLLQILTVAYNSVPFSEVCDFSVLSMVV